MNKQGGLMSKCVLLSVRPQYCELIANGKKTIEVRKTRPQMDTPFKCYIYCTIGAPYLNRHNGYLYLEERDTLGGRGHGIYDRLNRKVIGEFVCDDIDEISVHYDTLYCVKNSQPNKLSQMCLTVDEVKQYLKDKNLGYNWHISALQIYDKPMELGEFTKYGYDSKMPCCRLICPPQSWAYVEELEGL